MRLKVDCSKDTPGEETPCAFFIEGRQVTVLTVVDRWLAFDHRYFKIQADDGDLYILRHDMTTDLWDITYFEQNSF